jgi:hypothetical protein
MAEKAIDVTRFDSVEALDIAFKKLKAKAPDGDGAAIETRRLEARAQYFEHRASELSLEIARRDALAAYPLARELEVLVTGKTAEEIFKAAKSVQERIVAMRRRDHEQYEELVAQHKAQAELGVVAAAKAAYGDPSGSAGAPGLTPKRYEESA